MNYCATHNQFYKDYCVYCGQPQPFTFTDAREHVCVSDQSTASKCVRCGRPMPPAWPGISVVMGDCGG